MDVPAVGLVRRLSGVDRGRQESAGFTGIVTALPGLPGNRAECPFPDGCGRQSPIEDKCELRLAASRAYEEWRTIEVARPGGILHVSWTCATSVSPPR